MVVRNPKMVLVADRAFRFLGNSGDRRISTREFLRPCISFWRSNKVFVVGNFGKWLCATRKWCWLLTEPSVFSGIPVTGEFPPENFYDLVFVSGEVSRGRKDYKEAGSEKITWGKRMKVMAVNGSGGESLMQGTRVVKRRR
ncbi:hypothetical protein L2E82_42773 [Cichorium intybus]|uniref:Uncharacterized protein n=1 Tax=Cichorium intybus TaxID=13427 RepID=A0ACB8ZLN4_CICIN|nr:hypothetical protein L2E82_42773 [Cichorium intybus]